MNKDEEDSSGKDVPKGVFDKESALATVAIRRMSRRNQWTDDEEEDLKACKGLRVPLARHRPDRRSQRNPSSEEVTAVNGYNERSYGKRELSRYQKKDVPRAAAVFDERTYQGLNPQRKDERAYSPISTSSFDIRGTTGSRTSWRSEEQLSRSEDIGFVPLYKEKETVSTRESRRPLRSKRESPVPVKEPRVPSQQSSPVPPASPATSLPRKGFVYEMARKYEEAHPDTFPKGKTFTKKTSGWRFQKQTLIGNGAVPAAPSPRSVSQPPAASAKTSVQEAVYAYERGSSPGLSQITSTSGSAETKEEDNAEFRQALVLISLSKNGPP
ncbi:hypothetical protein OESDEN_07037 [Oesophagostomum dentatum]|uniref:Uncharacterized protein n=1 Tax=Oesophagostomum dentatum TaxID=61180 RepID=A0A0B1T670_OESDE|nr:hypothetical protein OESDEN_07037 [Oesophagostomum dentatum]